MIGLILIFLVCLLGWLGALYLVYKQRTIMRLFGLLMMSIWLYMSIELMLWSARLPLLFLMSLGILPILFVMIGFKVYERSRELEKAKNDDKRKNEELVSA
jgi:Ca2+/Na+ antiporter